MSASGLTPGELQDAIDSGIERGFEVVRSEPTLLLVDLDTIAAKKQFDRTLRVFQQHYEMDEPVFTESKSGNTLS